MFEAYEKYLEVINAKIAKFFKQAETFVFCKEGCSICCEQGQYPFSELEFKYLLYGSLNLKPEQIAIIDENIVQIKKEQRECEDVAKFMYRCPFLIDNRCCVYAYRGLICRTHGLAFYIDENDNFRVPGCFNHGLNYSNVAEVNENGDAKLYSREKFEQLGITDEPLAYNLSLKFLLNNEGTKYLELEFGENKPLIDWLEEAPDASDAPQDAKPHTP